MVRAEGLEPPRLSAPEPKSGASTNSATPAQGLVDSRAEGLAQLLAFAPCKLGRKPKQGVTNSMQLTDKAVQFKFTDSKSTLVDLSLCLMALG